tara:strand:- start:410 stop:955 length:546 start_codon:yes stop_codon:yes gene_type:complete
MKFNTLIKVTPLLSTLLLLTILSINNQKEYTRLRILIWNTPSLKIGTYLAISTGTGFILSYVMTTNLTNINNSKPKQILQFKDEVNDVKANEYIETDNNQSYDYTLIERDIKDPSPTINANFRIIGRTQGGNSNFINRNTIPYEDTTKLEEQSYEEPSKNKTINQVRSISNDWNDESFSTW